MKSADSWHDFYVALAGSAAVLIGLLFVGLSIHLAVVLARPEIRALARQTLMNFLTVLLVSLFLLVPKQSSSKVAWELGIIAVINLRALMPTAFDIKSRKFTLGLRTIARRYGTNLLADLGLLAVAIDFWRRTGAGFSPLIAVVLVLLLLSVWNSWDLLVSIEETISKTTSTGLDDGTA